MIEEIKQQIKECLEKYYKETYNVDANIIVEEPKNPAMGDIALPMFTMIKTLKKPVPEITKEASDVISKSFDVIENINPTGPFINIVLNKALISDHIIKDVFEKKEEYGTSTIGCGQTVVLDYSSPNIAKSFSVGHLRSTMIGNSLKLILNRCGYKTVSINYLGDWGTQFGKMIVAIEKWGNLDEIKKDPINQLGKLYVKINNEDAYKLNYNHDDASGGYKSLDFYVGAEDANLNYLIYRFDEITNDYILINDDNDDDTVISKIDLDDRGWYEISFIALNDKYQTKAIKQERAINDYYIASNLNDYLFDEYGNHDLNELYKFTEIKEDNDDLYNKDYAQYLLYLTIDEYQAKNKVEFYITDGVKDYKDGSNYISLNQAGTYEIIFSPDHVYSRLRNYKYSLLADENVKEEVVISNVSDFVNFVNMIFFMLTNILTESSELLCGGPEAKEKILNAYDLPEDTDTIMLKGVVSRKKQLVPTLVSVLQQ